ncbi:hypothetical protein NZNM25_09990 [Nitrosopumilus zosterae]|uniref:Uncharacterized protein n=1 Tax=Nitrosopumilus zosterae TaxID=718286 RepID=A0A2S2KRY2_9ARCH|nr:hypothetical protein [Nitrosopumilus zosterae]BDQ30359.1 hypothetical protein NZOSNM25_000461 [Nitrosopumilus zosterae]GBH34208.1 hypothetical protein NZNM25_09990 [Nitrosopumilus zosterae]
MSQLLEQRQPEPKNILVERTPVKDGTKLSNNSLSWEDIRGLIWLETEDDF